MDTAAENLVHNPAFDDYFDVDETHSGGVACADLNLDHRLTNWYGDPTLSYGSPCIVPQMRNVLANGLLDQLGNAMKTAR